MGNGEKAAAELVKSLVDSGLPPVSMAARVLGALVGKPDLDRLAAEQLQEDVVRLFALIGERVAGLPDELKAKIDPIEALEITQQTIVRMGHTARAEKRPLMANVAVNALAPDADLVEARLFGRLLDTLDIEQVALLAQGLPTPERPALVEAGHDFGTLIPDGDRLTELGKRFLFQLRDPT